MPAHPPSSPAPLSPPPLPSPPSAPPRLPWESSRDAPLAAGMRMLFGPSTLVVADIRHGLSLTAYCAPGEQRVLRTGAHQLFSMGCAPCPAGTTSWGGLSEECLTCTGLHCASSINATSLLDASFDLAELGLASGDEVRVQVDVSTSAGRAHRQATQKSDWIKVDSTPPAAGRVFDALACTGLCGEADEADVEFVPQDTSNLVGGWWTDFDDMQSGIDHYLVCAGTRAGECDLAPLLEVPRETKKHQFSLDRRQPHNVHRLARALRVGLRVARLHKEFLGRHPGHDALYIAQHAIYSAARSPTSGARRAIYSTARYI